MARNKKIYDHKAPHRLFQNIDSTLANGKETREAWAKVDNLLREAQPGVHEDIYFRRYTALQLAARYGRLEVVNELLRKPEFVANIQEENEKGQTALHLAAKGGYREIVEKLISTCESCSLEVFVNVQSHYRQKPDKKGRKEAGPNDISSRNTGWLPHFPSERRQCPEKNVDKTALHYAIARGHAETVQFLLSVPQVDVDLQDREGNTALHLAISENSKSGVDGLHLLKQLLAHIPSVNLNLNGTFGDTPLHTAVRKENIDAIELLCEQRRLIATKRNNDEMTPLRLAWELQKNKSSNQDLLEIAKNTLLERADVRRDDEKLKSEREVLYTAVNALLVGGTLLASITFGGILEMPTLPPETHFAQLTNSTGSVAGVPVPAQEVDYADRQWLYVRVIDIFRGSNNMCFFLAVITLMLAIQVPISRRNKKKNIYVEEEVEHLGTSSVLVSFCLTLSTFGAGVAFVTGGLAKVPVTESGWSLVLSRWIRNEWKNLFKSTMLTTNLSMGFVLFLILSYTISMDYFFILRYQVSKKYSLSSLATFLFSLLLFSLVMVVVVLLIFGSGLFQRYRDAP